MRAILDVDPGIDDALALLLALRSPEIDLLAVTTVAGNVQVDRGVRNALAILEAAGAEAIPVYPGAGRPLVGRLTTASFFHGADGLGGVRLPEAHHRPQALSAAQCLVEAARAADEPLTVIALGPLTNLALACRLDAGWASRTHRVVMAAGAVAAPGNVSPVAEANVYTDPEAAAVVLGSGAAITMVGLDVAIKAALPTERFWHIGNGERLAKDRVARLAHSLLSSYLRMSDRIGHSAAALHDPLAVGVACCRDLVSTRRLRVEVECAGALTRGQTIAWLSGEQERIEARGEHDDVVAVEPVEGNIDVAMEVDAGGFLALFLERLGLAEG